MRTQSLTGVVALSLITLAGTAIGDDRTQPSNHSPATTNRTMDKTNPHGTSTMTNGRQHFMAGKKFIGTNVKNSADETVGSIDDLIIDRGSGQVRYVVLKSGSVLGMGGKLVTVPYQSFGWDNADKDPVFNATKDEIKTWPEFDKKAWAEGANKEDSLIRRIGKDYFNTKNSPWPDEVRDTDNQRIQGTVKNFTRRTGENGSEELFVVVTSPGQPDREVGLGPSWYMAGNNSIAFYRDSPIDINVIQVDRAGKPMTIARSASVNGKEMRFYDEKGRARWTGNTNMGDSTNRDMYSTSPFVLYSEVKGKAVDCRGEKCGKVDEVIVECVSGTAAFLSIDPDQNTLGIGDEDRLVPWTIVTRSNDDMVHLDASKSMIVGGSATPKDLKSLNDRAMSDRIYSGYGVTPSEWRTNR
jgi:sporulation protein YlmC with PRC-barrel domain